LEEANRFDPKSNHKHSPMTDFIQKLFGQVLHLLDLGLYPLDLQPLCVTANPINNDAINRKPIFFFITEFKTEKNLVLLHLKY
jgi:hypothetical protein